MSLAAPATASATADVAVIILTYNEEANIAQALDSIVGWARQIFVLDSFSTDRTLEIARRYPCEIVQHRFESYAKQRNAALSELPIEAEWIFFLDADEWLPNELKAEIAEVIASNPREAGYYVNRRFLWLERWVRRGYYPTWIVRLGRRGKVCCEDRPLGEHLLVEGLTGHLRNDFMHDDRKGIAEWVEKHIRYATAEANELLREEGHHAALPGRLLGTQPERKRWLRHHVWERLPPLVRPFIYFAYRGFVRGGVLDGPEAFSYHFLQALWFPFLIDVLYLERRLAKRKVRAER